MTDRVVSPTELDLRRVTTPGLELNRVFAPADVQQGVDDLKPVGDVTFTGQVLAVGEQYRLVGHITATLELDCGRCLEPFRMPVDLDVDLTYVQQPVGGAPSSDDEVELRDEDLTTAYYRDEVLDLAHMLREQFYLVMPMRPLCGEDCRGLCPQCGANLNVETCGCTTTWHDPRLEALRTLIEKQDG